MNSNLLLTIIFQAAALITDSAFRAQVTDVKSAARLLWERLQPDLEGTDLSEDELAVLRQSVLDRLDRIDEIVGPGQL